MAVVVTGLSHHLQHIPPSLTWLIVFLPALSYFLATRMHPTIGGSASATSTTLMQLLDLSSCPTLSTVFWIDSCSEQQQQSNQQQQQIVLKYGMDVVLENLPHIGAMIWRHDSELGRGYVLLSQVSHNGRIWRWEVGGGPIAIGKTLHLEHSGCRSSIYHTCAVATPRNKNDEPTTVRQLGSGGIAIDFHGKDSYTEGLLTVAEYGEGRIVRLEENGARTPLVIQLPVIMENRCNDDEWLLVPNTINHTTSVRIHQPTALLYTPLGDLLFVDRICSNQTVLFRLRNAVHVEPLSTLEMSRVAHAWSKVPSSTGLPEIMYEGLEGIGGMTLSSDGTAVLVSGKIGDSIVLISVPILDPNDDDEEEENQLAPAEPKMVLNLSNVISNVKSAGGVTGSVDGLFFWAVDDAVLVVDGSNWIVLGRVPLNESPTALTIGEDKFLYITTKTQLLRMRLKKGPASIPTNLVRKSGRSRVHSTAV